MQNSSEPTIVVKTLVPEHTCEGDPNGKNPLTNSKWVTKMLEKDVRVHHKTNTYKNIVLKC